MIPSLIFLFVIVLFLAITGIRVVQQYERGVIFVLGRLTGASGPGLFWVPPFISRLVRVDLRTVTMEVPPQEIITRDNVPMKVTAVVYFRVVDPSRAVTEVMDFVRATAQIAQTTLRNILGQSELDEVLSKRDHINNSLQVIIDQQTEPWGVKVSLVEVKDVELPQSMQRAMAKQAEAEREKRAKIIHAEGEFQASAQLAKAAQVITSQPSAIQLRYLQTLTEIAVEKNSTIIFPIPLDLIEPFLKKLRSDSSGEERRDPREEPVSDLAAQAEAPTGLLPPVVEQPSLSGVPTLVSPARNAPFLSSTDPAGALASSSPAVQPTPGPVVAAVDSTNAAAAFTCPNCGNHMATPKAFCNRCGTKVR